MSRGLRPAPWIVGLLALFAVQAARPQGNIDAGKSPSQMFTETCTACHKSAQKLKRGASASFLRQHYMPGSEEASAMASYLAKLTSEPKGIDQRKLRTAEEKAKAQEERPKSQEERAKAQEERAQARLERAKALREAREAKLGKGRRGSELAKAPVAPPPEAPPPEPVQNAEAPPPTPKLAPFEE